MSAPGPAAPREPAISPRESAISPREFAISPREFADPPPSLAVRQAELVAALVAGAPDPAGFDPARLGATRRALLRKRAGEAAKHWPLLAAASGPDWVPAFSRQHAGHESQGPLRDGWDLARALRDRGDLPIGAAGELAARESALRYDGRDAPRPRLLRRVLDRLHRS